MKPSTSPRRSPSGAALFSVAALLSVLALGLGAVPAHAALPVALLDPARLGSPPPVSPLRLEINLPAFRLDAFVHDELVASYLVTVGKPDEPTEPGRHEITTVTWNPWWHPPDHRRPKDRVTPPGPRNPMGRVKLNLRGLYFIHGTALDKEIGRPMSRGCIRLRNEDAVALARLVHAHAGPAVPPSEIDALATSSRRTRGLPLTLPVPVQIVYRLAEVRDGLLAVYPDIYRVESRPMVDVVTAALAETGVPVERLDHSALVASLSGLPKQGVRGLSVESLLLPALVADEPLPASEPAGEITVGLRSSGG